MFPDILPGGGSALFTVDRGPGPGNEEIALLNLETGEHRVVIPSGILPRYSPTGHIVYGVDGRLRAVAFDLSSLQVTSNPVPVVEGVAMTATGAPSFDLSETGSLVYVSGGPAGVTRTLVWVDRDGREEQLPLPPRTYQTPRASPDGTRLAVAVREQEGTALWVYDVASAGGLRLTEEAADANLPLWMPDGDRLVFGWTRGNLTRDIYWVSADGSDAPERLTTSDTFDSPTSLTPDGSAVVFVRIYSDRREICHAPIDGSREPAPVVQGGLVNRGNPQVSPDGRWLAYRADQSGQMEIYVQPYPGPGPTVPVSIGGATT